MNGHRDAAWGSDAIAALLRALDFPYVALLPGSSFRGLHDSIVNYETSAPGGNPRMLLCLHEEHCVAIAHGYAKVAERPLLAIVHSNVGLMHASMAIFNAFCDRVPALILTGTGPLDAARRRPWIDWIHTPQTQGEFVRGFTKWDDQPLSLDATLESILRANAIARTAPCGPTVVAIDLSVQEQPSVELRRSFDPARVTPPHAAEAATADVARAVALLTAAARPVMLAGRASRDPAAWQRRIALAERLQARVVADLRSAASFPTDHPLGTGVAPLFLSDAAKAALHDADVVLNLDYLDLAGALTQSARPPGPTIVSASLDRYAHASWSRDHHALAEVDLDLAVDPDRFVAQLLDALGVDATATAPYEPVTVAAGDPADRDALDVSVIGAIVGELQDAGPVCLIRTPVAGLGAGLRIRHPLDHLGLDGGGGIGSGPGMAVGAALALRDTAAGRLPLAILGDGDFLMGASALWTAVANDIPLLVIVSNNRSFFNDELHQERVARERGRPVERRWIGQRIGGPNVDIAAHARSLGALAFGPVTTAGDLRNAVHESLQHVARGGVAVIDALVVSDDGGGGSYSKAGAAAMTGGNVHAPHG